MDADASLAKPFAHGDALRAAAARVTEVDAALAASNEKSDESPAAAAPLDAAAARARASVSASFPGVGGAIGAAPAQSAPPVVVRSTENTRGL